MLTLINLSLNINMKISRNIHIQDTKDDSTRIEFNFDPPVEITSPLGALCEIYDGIGLTANMVAEKTFSGINANGILHVNEVMQAGEVFSIEIRKGYRLDEIVIAQENTLQIMVAHNCLQYWFIIGKNGVFEVTGKMIKDDDGFLGKLRADLKDTNMRSYLVKKSLADSDPSTTKIDNIQDVMKHKEAAAYLRMASQTLYNKVSTGEITRRSGKVYLKEDLDTYLRKTKKRR